MFVDPLSVATGSADEHQQVLLQKHARSTVLKSAHADGSHPLPHILDTYLSPTRSTWFYLWYCDSFLMHNNTLKDWGLHHIYERAAPLSTTALPSSIGSRSQQPTHWGRDPLPPPSTPCVHLGPLHGGGPLQLRARCRSTDILRVPFGAIQAAFPFSIYCWTGAVTPRCCYYHHHYYLGRAYDVTDPLGPQYEGEGSCKAAGICAGFPGPTNGRKSPKMGPLLPVIGSNGWMSRCIQSTYSVSSYLLDGA